MESPEHRAGTGTALIDLEAPAKVDGGATTTSGNDVAVARRQPVAFVVLLMVAAVALWVAALQAIDPSKIGDYGLISAFPRTMWAALGVLTVSFCIALHARVRSALLGAHAVLLVLMLHATPTIAYGTLRYAWAWKHLGLVDYYHRHKQLWPESPTLTVYHNWPGFFSLVTQLTEASGVHSANSFAAWCPPFFELLNVLAITCIFASFTTDRRVIALGVWFFVLGNWVGQDYFAPQAFAYLLYLVVIAILLRWFRTNPEPKRFLRVRQRIQRRVGRDFVEEPPTPVLAPRHEQRTPLLFIVLLLMIAIATSHPLTPFLLIFALTALAITRAITVRILPLVMAAITLAWLCTGAWPYVSPNARAMVSELGALGANVDSKLDTGNPISHSQLLISSAGRYVVLLLVGLAGIGFLRRLRVGRLETAMVALMAAPVGIAVAGSYGGEVIFRVFLFALPFAAYLAARAFLPSEVSGRGWFTTILVCGTSAVLLAGFSLAYYGKEGWTYFSPDEVKATEAVFENAPDHSLFIAFNTSLPNQFANYERFTYVWILEEPRQTQNRIIADPVDVLVDWMENPHYARSFLVISRAQQDEINALGEMPPGSLEAIRAKLKASGRFDIVFDDKDATVFSLSAPQSAARGT
jgi:hypothetical protein